jgi:hypothetical protein
VIARTDLWWSETEGIACRSLAIEKRNYEFDGPWHQANHATIQVEPWARLPEVEARARMEAAVVLGWAHAAQRASRQGKALLKGAITVAPTSLWLRVGLGDALQQQGRHCNAPERAQLKV